MLVVAILALLAFIILLLTRSPVLGLASLELLLLFLALMTALGGVGGAPAQHYQPQGTVSASKTLHLCGLTINVTAMATSGKDSVHLVVYATVQPPNPCYRLVSSATRVSGGFLVIEYTVESPKPGTYCVQVLPPPSRSKTEADIYKRVEGIKIVVLDKTTGRACEGLIPLALGPFGGP
jgi:hypothetical protein